MSFNINDKEHPNYHLLIPILEICTTVKAHMAKMAIEYPSITSDKPMPYNTNWEWQKAREMLQMMKGDRAMLDARRLSENDRYLAIEISNRVLLTIKSETVKL